VIAQYRVVQLSTDSPSLQFSRHLSCIALEG
jgi:hypothetical protein